MNCEEIHIRLSALVDNRLDPGEKAAIEKHLEECVECRIFYRRLKKLETMADDYRLSADDEYWLGQKDKVLEKIEQIESSGKIIPAKKKNSHLWYRLAAVAAVVVIVGSISIYESQNLETTKGIFENHQPVVSTEKETALPGEADSLADRDAVEIKTLAVAVEPSETAGSINETETKIIRRSEMKPQIGIPRPVVDNALIEKEMVVDKADESGTRIDLGVSDDEFTDASKTLVSSKESLSEEINSEKTETVYRDKKEPVKAEQSTKRSIAQYYDVVSEPEPAPEPGPEPVPVPSVADMESGSFKLADLSVERRNDSIRQAHDDLMAEFDVEYPSTGRTRAELDPVAFAEFSDDEKELYHLLKQKVENLNNLYGDLMSPHYEEAAAKSRMQLSGDSLSLITREMAEAYYHLGMLTPIEGERKGLLEMLNKLLMIADKNDTPRINEYKSDIEGRSGD